MLKELLNVAGVVRPRHLLKALLHPAEELRAFMYHYRRVPSEEFVRVLAGAHFAQEGRGRSVTAELEANASFLGRLRRELQLNHRDGYGGQMTREAPAIYALVRLLRPRVIVETGVADGVTSSYILQALEDNGEGRLYSVDLPHYLLPEGKGPGWIVDDRLRGRWDLRVGKAEDLLPPLLEELGSIDMFLHDSLHTYEHMLFEFRSAWPRLKPGGLFLSHDVGQNRAFADFIREEHIKWSDWRVFHVLGGFRKPPVPEEHGGSL